MSQAFRKDSKKSWITRCPQKNYSSLNEQPGLGDSEQGAVSVGSPSQASTEGALMQWRNLNFLPLDEVGSHSDHLPHSAQSPETANKKDQTISDALHTVG